MDDDGKTPLPWRQRRTPKRGSRKSRNWRRIYVGYRFPGTAWEVLEGPYRRVRRHKSKSWVVVKCLDCGNSFERRLDHIVGGRSHRCNRCAPHRHKPWEHWQRKAKEQRESMDGVTSLTVSETDQEQESE